MNRADQCLQRPQEADYSTGSGCGQWLGAGASKSSGGGRCVRLRCHCSVERKRRRRRRMRGKGRERGSLSTVLLACCLGRRQTQTCPARGEVWATSHMGKC